MRINRFLARSGVASRRKAEDIILSGKVCVNGETVMDFATEVDPATDAVTVDGKRIELPKFAYLALNKPAGYTTTKSDPHAEHTIFELLPNDPSLIAVGRLDRDTTGLILITNDGDFAQNIIHPSKKIDKVYLVKLNDKISMTNIQKLLNGIELEDGIAKAKNVEQVSDHEILLAIEMGKKRIVRRMITAIGNGVTELKRIRIGKIPLDVEEGKYRNLTDEEIRPYV